jgi:hypothetical protein
MTPSKETIIVGGLLAFGLGPPGGPPLFLAQFPLRIVYATVLA